MKGIVYISHAKTIFTEDALHTLANFAANCNQNYAITGYLYFEKEYFLQYIEGEAEDIDTLLTNITRDSRHEVLTVHEDLNRTTRRFPTWHMQQLNKSSLMQINVENVLMDYLTNNHKQNNIFLNSDHIWRMVNKLSEYRTKIFI